MNTRVIWRRAHPVRLPDKVNTPPHVEMFAAYAVDKINWEIADDLARELEKDVGEFHGRD